MDFSWMNHYFTPVPNNTMWSLEYHEPYGINLHWACTVMHGSDIALLHLANRACDDMMSHGREYQQCADTDIPTIVQKRQVLTWIAVLHFSFHRKHGSQWWLRRSRHRLNRKDVYMFTITTHRARIPKMTRFTNGKCLNYHKDPIRHDVLNRITLLRIYDRASRTSRRGDEKMKNKESTSYSGGTTSLFHRLVTSSKHLKQDCSFLTNTLIERYYWNP